MDAVKFLQEFKRMCGSTTNYCVGCPLEKTYQDDLTCKQFMFEFPEKTVSIVEQWSKEHPITTNIDMFIRVFGHVENNIPSLTWWQEEYKKPNEC